jgi:hypothetical protein
MVVTAKRKNSFNGIVSPPAETVVVLSLLQSGLLQPFMAVGRVESPAFSPGMVDGAKVVPITMVGLILVVVMSMAVNVDGV